MSSARPRMDTNARMATFLGVDFDLVSQTETIDWIERKIGSRDFFYIVTPNVDHIVRLHDRGTIGAMFEQVYRKASLRICDSRVLSRLAKMSRSNLTIVPGSDLTATMIRRGGLWKRLAVVGGDHELRRKLERDYPQYDWVFHEPPLGVLHSPVARQAIGAFVENAGADVIFFAIGAPQSELCCLEIKVAGKARGVALCIGASLEFLTGTKARAPVWMQRSGLEWVHRLLSEPRRLWHRYLIEGPKILYIWWRWRP